MSKRSAHGATLSLPASKSSAALPNPYASNLLSDAARQARASKQSYLSQLPGDMFEAMLVGPYLDSLLAPPARLKMPTVGEVDDFCETYDFSLRQSPAEAMPRLPRLATTARGELASLLTGNTCVEAQRWVPSCGDRRRYGTYTREWWVNERRGELLCATMSGHLVLRSFETRGFVHQAAFAVVGPNGEGAQATILPHHVDEGARLLSGAMRRPGVFCVVKSALGSSFAPNYIELRDFVLGSQAKPTKTKFAINWPPEEVDGADNSVTLQVQLKSYFTRSQAGTFTAQHAMFLPNGRLLLAYDSRDPADKTICVNLILLELTDGQPAVVVWKHFLHNCQLKQMTLLDDSHKLLLYTHMDDNSHGFLIFVPLDHPYRKTCCRVTSTSRPVHMTVTARGLLIFVGALGTLTFARVVNKKFVVIKEVVGVDYLHWSDEDGGSLH